VLLLTAHNAKGLEFPVVIVAGLEEGLLPHGASSEDEAELEEERRLFYVAITRAREEVLLTAAAYRRRFDGARGAQVSRFVGEIPEEVLEREALPGAAARGMSQREDAAPRPGLRHRGAPAADSAGPRHRALGREVFHERFGRGVVVEADGEGADARFTVRFGTTMKRVMGRYLDGGSDADPS
jgi:DNA helicase-2/ATP-dependent DNA helicase PcrA